MRLPKIPPEIQSHDMKWPISYGPHRSSSRLFTQCEQKTKLNFVFEGKHGEGLDIIHSFITDPNIDHEIAPESGKRFEYTPIELVSNNLMHEGTIHFSITLAQRENFNTTGTIRQAK